MRAAREESLLSRHDALLVDLDGVVYLGAQLIDGAAEALDAAKRARVAVVFVTNNASRTPADVAAALSTMGVEAEPDDVITSSTAAADHLAAELPVGAAVLVVGGDGLRQPVRAAGLRPVDSADEFPVAVVQGWSPDLTWKLLAEGAVAVRRGARWVATNDDATLPSERGPLPGNGAMVTAVATATGTKPFVIGKPAPTLFETAARAVAAAAPLVVGDRLDTDIAGAVAAGVPSLLVLTGVSRAIDLMRAAPEHRPTYVGRDLGALQAPAVPLTDDGAVGDGLDALRAHVRQAWSGALRPEQYDDVVRELGLN